MRPISQHPHPSSLGRLAGAHKQCISSASLGLSCCPLTASSFNSELKDSPTEHQIHKACLWLVFQSLQLIYLICLSFGWILLHVFQKFKQMTKICEFHSTSVRPISMPMVLLCSCSYWPITAYHSMPRRWWVAQVRSGWSWVSLPCNGCGYWATTNFHVNDIPHTTVLFGIAL